MFQYNILSKSLYNWIKIIPIKYACQSSHHYYNDYDYLIIKNYAYANKDITQLWHILTLWYTFKDTFRILTISFEKPALYFWYLTKILILKNKKENVKTATKLV